jgi:FtsP/CotA-like multicopper oxidase with cupredoxin domain
MSMPSTCSRRAFLAQGAGALGLLAVSRRVRAQEAASPREFALTAAQSDIDVGAGLPWQTWAYNGTVPGPLLRATEGERIRVVLENHLSAPTTIHWHGVPVPNVMDGVPGVTQPSVNPGEQFVYEFDAPLPGTYFYHSHVGLQLDRGLLGALIVDPREPELLADREEVLVLDDWLPTSPDDAFAAMQATSGAGGGMMGGGMMGGGMGGRAPAGGSGMAGGTVMTEPPYAGYLVNGRVGAGAMTLALRRGERVRLRIINAAAATTFRVGITGHTMTVTHADGRPVAPVDVDTLVIGMGERYDVVVTATQSGQWWLLAGPVDSSVPGITVPVVYEGASTSPQPPFVWPPALIQGRVLSYDVLRPTSANLGDPFTDARPIALLLSGGMGTAGWTINGQAYPNADPIPIRLGERIRLQFRNLSPVRHPMHLHGHFFQLVDRTTGRATGAVKDTVLVEPMMGAVDVEFIADNPGAWMLHCHHAYHMEAGMARVIEIR